MRVLIIRPEREATALAAALAERGHVPVIAPLFHLEFLHPPADFAASLAACQAVLLTSANGARALADASHQRGRPILAVGDTTAATAEGLGFGAVRSAAAHGAGDGAGLAELVRQRLKPGDGPLIHVTGREAAFDFAQALAPAGFAVTRFALYEAREETKLPESARAALEARALDVATFFSPRAASVFATMVDDAGLKATLRGVTAIAISPAALAPVAGLPFKATVAAARPTRQAVLDEIDRLAADAAAAKPAPVPAPVTAGPWATEPPVTEPQAADAITADAKLGAATMSDQASSPAGTLPAPIVRRGLGVVGAFVIGLVAAVIVLAGALVALPFLPAPIQERWHGRVAAVSTVPSAPAIDLQAVRADAATVASTAADAVRRDLAARLDELEKRRPAAANAPAATATPPATAAAPAAPDPAIAELRRKVEALEKTVANPAEPAAPAGPTAADAEKEVAVLTREVATLRTALQALDQSVTQSAATQRDQNKALSDAVTARSDGEKKALSAALSASRASAVVGVAARLSGSLEAGAAFAADIALLAPLIQGDATLTSISAALQPYGQKGVASVATLEAEFPAVAKAALADDLADNSYGERLVGKLRGLVSLRRVGDVPGDSTEARLARAEQALHGGDLAKAVELVKSLPPQTAKATEAWLARADAHLAAQRTVDQLAAYAVGLLGSVNK